MKTFNLNKKVKTLNNVCKNHDLDTMSNIWKEFQTPMSCTLLCYITINELYFVLGLVLH